MKKRGIVPTGVAVGRSGGVFQPRPLEPGVGSELLSIFKSDPIGKHATSCPACRELARKMNEWGAEGCREHMQEIVEDILPRAKQWTIAAAGGKIKGFDPSGLDKAKLKIAKAWKFASEEPTRAESLKAAAADRVMSIWIKRQVKRAIRQWENKPKEQLTVPKPEAVPKKGRIML